MAIERFGDTNSISDMVIHGDIVYLCGITANPSEPLGDVKQ